MRINIKDGKCIILHKAHGQTRTRTGVEGQDVPIDFRFRLPFLPDGTISYAFGSAASSSNCATCVCGFLWMAAAPSGCGCGWW
jgi:hypothetical protein